MRNGKVKFYNEKKGFGFITVYDANIDIYVSKLDLLEEIKDGDEVTFQVDRAFKGPIAKQVRIRVPEIEAYEEISDDQEISESLESLLLLDPKKILSSISYNWKLEAKLENNKYFYHYNEVNSILNKEKYYVIGRKGSGKSSISEYLLSQHSHDVFSEKLSFKNFPFNDLYHLDNQKYTPPNQYITIWKFLIYSTVAKLMTNNQRINFEIRKILSEIYQPEPIKSLSRTISKWTSAEFGATILGTGGRLKLGKEINPQSSSWIEKANALEDLILEHCDDSKYFIIFDELDEDYRNIKSSDHNLYNYLLTSLFKAVQDVKYTFNGTRINICPVVFVRDDIYSLIRDADKNKWRDYKIEIEWSKEKIRKMLAYRITQDAAVDKPFSFKEAWDSIFLRDQIKLVGSKSNIDTFDYITRSTHLRPRDFIRYFQACAEETLNSSAGRISNQTVKFVDRAFSNYLKDEIVDELFPVLPDIEEILQIISNLRKWLFTLDEFKSEYMKYLKAGTISEANMDYVLDTLFRYSVLGNQDKKRGELFYFKYMHTNMNLNRNERLVVHRGLFKSLSII